MTAPPHIADTLARYLLDADALHPRALEAAIFRARRDADDRDVPDLDEALSWARDQPGTELEPVTKRDLATIHQDLAVARLERSLGEIELRRRDQQSEARLREVLSAGGAIAVGLFCLQVFPNGISDALDGDSSTDWAYVDMLGPLLFILALTYAAMTIMRDRTARGDRPIPTDLDYYMRLISRVGRDYADGDGFRPQDLLDEMGYDGHSPRGDSARDAVGLILDHLEESGNLYRDADGRMRRQVV